MPRSWNRQCDSSFEVGGQNAFLRLRNSDRERCGVNILLACKVVRAFSEVGGLPFAGSEQKPLTMGVRTVCSALLPANGGGQNGRRKARALDAALRGSG